MIDFARGERGNAEAMEVDSTLSATSTNPVTNAAITSKVNQIEKIIGDINTALESIIGE